MKILLLSDTHGHLDDRILHYAESADEILHAGDFGSVEIIEKLEAEAPVRGVYGNIDGAEVRTRVPESMCFTVEGLRVAMCHIGGYPKRYTPLGKTLIEQYQPGLFISGHSHILKVMPDEQYGLLHMNPGAAGKSGWHKVRTMLIFDVAAGNIANLQVIELGKR